MLRITLRSAKRRTSRTLEVNAPSLKTGWVNRFVVAVVTDQAGVGQALAEPLDDLVAGRVVAAEGDQVVVVEVHAVGAELASCSSAWTGSIGGRVGVPERITALPADGPQPERELVVGGRGRVGSSQCLFSLFTAGRSSPVGHAAPRSARARAGRDRRKSVPTVGSGQSGGWAAPDSAHAACRAAPRATYSPSAGRTTSRPRIDGASARTAALRAAPPTSNTRRGSTAVRATRASTASASEHSRASTAARARSARVVAGVRPCQVPTAAGPVRRALASVVRRQRQPARAGLGRERHRAELVVVDAEPPRLQVEDASGVHRRDHGQESAASVGEAGHRAGPVGDRGRRHCRRDTRGADRDEDVARRQVRGRERPPCCRRYRRRAARRPASCRRRHPVRRRPGDSRPGPERRPAGRAATTRSGRRSSRCRRHPRDR